MRQDVVKRNLNGINCQRGTVCYVRESGFSLLEILVAFSILAISLGILFQIFSKGIQLASTGEHYSRALLLAESTLATIGRTEEIEIGENSGEVDGFYTWTVIIELYEPEDLDLENPNINFSVYHIQVSVHWENRSVVLETLQFGPQV